MNDDKFDLGTEELYQNFRIINSLPLIRFGCLAAIVVYFVTAFLEAYVFLAIDQENSPWFLITAITCLSLAALYEVRPVKRPNLATNSVTY